MSLPGPRWSNGRAHDGRQDRVPTLTQGADCPVNVRPTPSRSADAYELATENPATGAYRGVPPDASLEQLGVLLPERYALSRTAGGFHK